MNDIQIGDICSVDNIDRGQRYRTYWDWVQKYAPYENDCYYKTCYASSTLREDIKKMQVI